MLVLEMRNSPLALSFVDEHTWFCALDLSLLGEESHPTLGSVLDHLPNAPLIIITL